MKKKPTKVRAKVVRRNREPKRYPQFYVVVTDDGYGYWQFEAWKTLDSAQLAASEKGFRRFILEIPGGPVP